MSLIKRNFPFSDLTDFFNDDWAKSRFGNVNWSPAINVVDNENNFEIEVAAPGIKKDDFSVEVDNGILTINGKAEEEKEEKKKNYTRKEFSSKSFSRSFTLPENVNEDDVEAKYENGLLKLVLKKTEKGAKKKKEIAIN